MLGLIMYQKKGPNTKPIMLALVVSRVVILVGIWRVFFRGPSSTVTEKKTLDEIAQEQEKTVKRWYIGEKVLFKGIMKPVEGFDVYTHSFTTEAGDKFGIKSAVVDLFEFDGNVQVKGEIVDFKKELPLIGVDEIVSSSASNSENGEDEVSIEPNKSLYYDLKNGLGVDLSISEGYEIKKGDGVVRVLDTKSGDDPVLSIEPFPCKSGDPLQDCDLLQGRFESFGNDSFVTTNGVKLYNLTETNTRFAFNGDYGYSFRASDTAKITTFGGLVVYLDEPKLDAYLIDKKDTCKDINSYMDGVSRIAYQDQGDGIVHATIAGKNNEGTSATCKVLLRLGTNLEHVLVGYKVLGEEEPIIENEVQEEEVELKEQQEEIPLEKEKEEIVVDKEEEVENERTVLEPNKNDVGAPSSFDGRLQYSSIRGFTMWFSKQGVSYVGTVLSQPTDLGMSGVSCPYKVNVIRWKEAENVTTSPDLEVYECTGTTKTKEEAIENGIQLVGSSGTKQFFVKKFTQNLGNIEIFVEAPKGNIEE